MVPLVLGVVEEVALKEACLGQLFLAAAAVLVGERLILILILRLRACLVLG